MADPHHIASLDGFDRLTVRSYRAGLAASAALLLLSAALHLAGAATEPVRSALVVAMTLSVAASCQSVHLYLKLLRWFLPVLAWTGAALQLVAPLTPSEAARWLSAAGFGFALAALSGLALKERICFRIPGLIAVPAVLALSLAPWLAGTAWAVGALHGVAGVILARLVLAKSAQPLHFDIGDKSAYQL